MIPKRETYIEAPFYMRSYFIIKKILILFVRFLGHIGFVRSDILEYNDVASTLFLKNSVDESAPTCTSCGDCLSICPTNCLEIKKPKGQDVPCLPQTFSFDHVRCITCWLCVEVCPEDAIDFKAQAQSHHDLEVVDLVKQVL